LSSKEVRFDETGSHAVLDVRRQIAIDTFQIFGPNSQPAEVRFRVVWDATGSPVVRGKGTAVPSTNEAAFLGQMAPARSVGRFSGQQVGFSFLSDDATTDKGYARIGTERNGSFLLES
jgi:hypothetical protein